MFKSALEVETERIFTLSQRKDTALTLRQVSVLSPESVYPNVGAVRMDLFLVCLLCLMFLPIDVTHQNSEHRSLLGP